MKLWHGPIENGLIALILLLAFPRSCIACGSGTATSNNQANVARDLARNLFGPKSKNLFPKFRSKGFIPDGFERFLTTAGFGGFFATTARPFVKSTTTTTQEPTTSTSTTARTTSTSTTALTTSATTTRRTVYSTTTRALTVTGPQIVLKKTYTDKKKVILQPASTTTTQKSMILTGIPWTRRTTTTPERSTTSSTVRQTTTRFSMTKSTTTESDLLQRESKESGRYPRDCADIQNMGIGRKSGVYKIFRPSCLNPKACAMNVTCDLQTDGGGWTIIQQRLDGTTSFFRDWKSYRDGFGGPKNFWLGNEYVYEVTNMLNTKYNMLVQMSDFDGRSRFSLYQNFRILSERDNYSLRLGSVFGTTKVDNLRASREAPFGTYDEDHDIDGTRSCGAHWLSGWWHHPACEFTADLNVPYKPQESHPYLQGILWISDNGPVRIRTTQIKIRPTDFVVA